MNNKNQKNNKKLLQGVQGDGFLEKSPPGRRRQKLLLELLLTLLFFIGAIVYVHTSDLRVGLQLVLRVKVSHQDTFQLFFKKDTQEVKNKASNHFQEVCFLLPPKKIKNLRLNFGQKPGIIAIESINIKNLAMNYQLKGKHLQKLLSKKHGVNKNYIKKNAII